MAVPTSSSQTTRSPRNTGPSAQARTSRGRRPRRPRGPAQPWHRPVAQVSGCSRATWLQAPAASAAAATAWSVGDRAGGVDDGGARALQHLPDQVGDGAALPDRPVAGHDRDRAGRAPGLQRGQQVGLVGAGDQQAHRAVALAQPLGQREQRRRRVALPHQQARHRLGGQRERPPERPGDLQRGAGRLGGQPGGARGRAPRRPARGWRRSRPRSSPCGSRTPGAPAARRRSTRPRTCRGGTVRRCRARPR